MQNPEQHSPPRRSGSALNRSIGSAVVALLPVFACFLGGATQKWAEGIVVAILGLYLLFRPPRLSLGLLTNCMLLGLVILSALAFLPHTWFFVPPWRIAITNDFDISLPLALTPQPWITA